MDECVNVVKSMWGLAPNTENTLSSSSFESQSWLLSITLGTFLYPFIKLEQKKMRQVITLPLTAAQ